MSCKSSNNINSVKKNNWRLRCSYSFTLTEQVKVLEETQGH